MNEPITRRGFILGAGALVIGSRLPYTIDNNVFREAVAADGTKLDEFLVEIRLMGNGWPVSDYREVRMVRPLGDKFDVAVVGGEPMVVFEPWRSADPIVWGDFDRPVMVDGLEVTCQEFHRVTPLSVPVNLCPGDTLEVTYNLEIDA